MDDLQQLPNRPKEIQDVIEWIQQTTGCPWRTDIKWNIISRHELFDWQGPIGEGSFGIVFRARWHTTPVAIKQSHAKIVGRKVFEGVRDEIEKWSRLHHPNVVQMLGACLHTNQPFLVMNYYRNGSLFGFVSRNQVSMKQRVKWMYDMAAGLDYIHKQSIIHGDLKADNVLVDHQYNALITDFGLSQMRSFNSSSCKNKTMTQAIRWIAPERYGRKFKMTPLYDVFAFGMTSYQALTSRVPFDEESNEEIVKEWIKQ
ncbi:kinase-like domain-containing protein, partial [Gorgonomyces haynaldii]